MEDQSKEIERLRLQVKNLEKLSSLGMLSAGIAHEIQNPLNFVINFSKLSSKLVDDLEDILEEEKDVLPPESWEKLTALHEEFSEIVNDLHGNLKKIEEHGNRATSIIRGILLYSRGKDDEYIPTDIKNLVKEYVWLAYHSMRANYKGFNIAIREHYEEGLPMLKVIPQDLSRAVLNVMNNACYAVYSKSKLSPIGYEPVISVDLRKEGDSLRLSIEDNGIGMPENIREQITNNYQHKDLFERLELGTISVEQFRDDIRALSGKPLTDEQIDTAWIAMLGDVPENKLRLLLELRERYNTMLLSNTNELHWKWSEDTYFSYQGLCAQDFFHKIYLSYELHMLKPNADIFEYVLKDSNLLAEETMLIDDASVNCRAAELLGMKSYMPQQREDWSHLFK